MQGRVLPAASASRVCPDGTVVPSHTACPEQAEHQVQAASQLRLQAIGGAQLALDALSQEKCWQAVADTGAEATREQLRRTPIVISSDGFSRPRSRAVDGGRDLVYDFARTEGGTIYMNALGNNPFMNPDDVEFIRAEDGRAERFSILGIESQNVGGTLSGDLFRAVTLLHELAHINGKISGDSNNRALSIANQRSIFEICFK